MANRNDIAGVRHEHTISLAPFTSYGIGGTARDVFFPATAAELLAVLRSLADSDTPYFVLGGGTNVLVGDRFWDGAVIVTTALDETHEEGGGLACGSGLTATRVAEIARDRGMTGLEFLYLLPGTIGGAVAGNARFADTSMSDILIGLLAVHPVEGARRFGRDEIDFRYKHTGIVREGWLIAETTLRWEAGDPAAVAERMAAIARFRHEKHHFEYPSCGCIFKNDHARNIQVGRLIDSLELKGMRVGGAEVAPFHGNFIINTGGATARDVRGLMERIEAIVLERTGIVLEREVHLYGTFE